MKALRKLDDDCLSRFIIKPFWIKLKNNTPPHRCDLYFDPNTGSLINSGSEITFHINYFDENYVECLIMSCDFNVVHGNHYEMANYADLIKHLMEHSPNKYKSMYYENAGYVNLKMHVLIHTISSSFDDCLQLTVGKKNSSDIALINVTDHDAEKHGHRKLILKNNADLSFWIIDFKNRQFLIRKLMSPFGVYSFVAVSNQYTDFETFMESEKILFGQPERKQKLIDGINEYIS